MVPLRLALLALFLPLVTFADDVGRRVYLLAKPAVRTMERGPLWTAVPVLLDLSYASAVTVGTYHMTGSPLATAGMAIYQFGTGGTVITGLIRQGTKEWFELTRTSELREIAREVPGARNIRVLSTTNREGTGFLSSRLQSLSLYFVEVEGDHVPESFRGSPWLPVDDLEGTKLRLELRYKDAPNHLPAAELSLKQLFEGTPLDVEVERVWREAIRGWHQDVSLWDRFLTHKSTESLKIRGFLVRGEEALEMGDMAVGKSVLKQIGATWDERLKRFFAVQVRGKTEEEARKKIRTRETLVISHKDCSTWYRRLLGRELLLAP